MVQDGQHAGLQDAPLRLRRARGAVRRRRPERETPVTTSKQWTFHRITFYLFTYLLLLLLLLLLILRERERGKERARERERRREREGGGRWGEKWI